MPEMGIPLTNSDYLRDNSAYIRRVYHGLRCNNSFVFLIELNEQAARLHQRRIKRPLAEILL